MIHIKKILFCFTKFSLVSMLVAISCSILINQGYQQSPQPKEVQLTEDGLACGSGTELNVGDTLILILNGNPATGYTWDVGYYVHPVIEPRGEPEYQPSSNLPRAVGTCTFRFHAVGEGQATLKLVYHRPQNENLTVLKTCDVNVTVK